MDYQSRLFESDFFKELKLLRDDGEFHFIEYVILLLMLSMTMWVCRAFFELQFLYTFLGIQIMLAGVLGSLIISEQNKLSRLRKIEDIFFHEERDYKYLDEEFYHRMRILEKELELGDFANVRDVLFQLLSEIRRREYPRREYRFELYRLIDRIIEILKRERK